ncbi:hypothetical protein [Candidatus Entotheonella palauensis]|uniref:Uncharacterized protein n=1 Tax=Candidatus Entotheonella gemina TaxID=1429439 RepID=W4M687_9BACT|nr:hypothetical protein [Candidatus Entotheonella palauensis]ETX05157.1 MAG: hypothetical protein ETSY2_24645 [Candidatus Entotheonella gemina]
MLGSKSEVADAKSAPTLLPLAVTVGFLVFLVTSGTPDGFNGVQGFFVGLVGTLVLGGLFLFIDAKNERNRSYQDDLDDMRKTLCEMKLCREKLSDISPDEMVITCQHCEHKIHVSLRHRHKSSSSDQD